ncbi:MAG: hypothetical protein V1820_05260 [archaeon]
MDYSNPWEEEYVSSYPSGRKAYHSRTYHRFDSEGHNPNHDPIYLAKKGYHLFSGATDALSNPLPYLADALGYDGDKLNKGLTSFVSTAAPFVVGAVAPEIGPLAGLAKPLTKLIMSPSMNARNRMRHDFYRELTGSEDPYQHRHHSPHAPVEVNHEIESGAVNFAAKKAGSLLGNLITGAL